MRGLHFIYSTTVCLHAFCTAEIFVACWDEWSTKHHAGALAAFTVAMIKILCQKQSKVERVKMAQFLDTAHYGGEIIVW